LAVAALLAAGAAIIGAARADQPARGMELRRLTLAEVPAGTAVAVAPPLAPEIVRDESLPRASSPDDIILALPIDPWSPRESEAVGFANELMIRARAVFADPSLDALTRRRAFRAMVSELFDVDALGQALLGDNLQRFTERQRVSYRAIVPDYLVRLYASRIYDVCRSNAIVISVEEQPRGVMVRTAYGALPGESLTVVDWLLDPHPDGSWRVLDMAVNGVSLALSKMEEFDSVLSSQGPDALLELLHAQAGQGLPRPLASPVAPEAAVKPN
jgi:phospholipid transport system substrate-binding protein